MASYSLIASLLLIISISEIVLFVSVQSQHASNLSRLNASIKKRPIETRSPNGNHYTGHQSHQTQRQPQPIDLNLISLEQLTYFLLRNYNLTEEELLSNSNWPSSSSYHHQKKLSSIDGRISSMLESFMTRLRTGYLRRLTLSEIIGESERRQQQQTSNSITPIPRPQSISYSEQLTFNPDNVATDTKKANVESNSASSLSDFTTNNLDIISNIKLIAKNSSSSMDLRPEVVMINQANMSNGTSGVMTTNKTTSSTTTNDELSSNKAQIMHHNQHWNNRGMLKWSTRCHHLLAMYKRDATMAAARVALTQSSIEYESSLDNQQQTVIDSMQNGGGGQSLSSVDQQISNNGGHFEPLVLYAGNDAGQDESLLEQTTISNVSASSSTTVSVDNNNNEPTTSSSTNENTRQATLQIPKLHFDDEQLLQLCELSTRCHTPEQLISLIQPPDAIKRLIHDPSSDTSEPIAGDDFSSKSEAADSHLASSSNTQYLSHQKITGSHRINSRNVAGQPGSGVNSNGNDVPVIMLTSKEQLSDMVVKLCPLLLFQLHDSTCSSRREEKPSPSTVWAFATLFVTIVSFCSLIGLSITPFIQGSSSYRTCLNLFEGLAVGSLVGSALFSLIPQAFELQEREANQGYLWKASIIFFGIYLFFCSERIMKIILDTRRKRTLNSMPLASTVTDYGCEADTSTVNRNKELTKQQSITTQDEVRLDRATSGLDGTLLNRLTTSYASRQEVDRGHHQQQSLLENSPSRNSSVTNKKNGSDVLLDKHVYFSGDHINRQYRFDETRSKDINDITTSDNCNSSPIVLSGSYSSSSQSNSKNSLNKIQNNTFRHSVTGISGCGSSNGSDTLDTITNSSGNHSQVNIDDTEDDDRFRSRLRRSNRIVRRHHHDQKRHRHQQQDLYRQRRRRRSSKMAPICRKSSRKSTRDTTFNCLQDVEPTIDDAQNNNRITIGRDDIAPIVKPHLVLRNVGQTGQQTTDQHRHRNRHKRHKELDGDIVNQNRLYQQSGWRNSVDIRPSQDQLKQMEMDKWSPPSRHGEEYQESYRSSGSKLGSLRNGHHHEYKRQQRKQRKITGSLIDMEIDEDIQHQQESVQDIATVAWMIVLGDGLHNFIDGLSIGAAFSESILSGVSISVAVICEEFPHELGDFAVLISSGMTIRQALGYNFLSACTCYVGMIFGILLGDMTDAAAYISAMAGGVFLYIALVDMMGELSAALEEMSRISITKTLKLLLLQNIGILSGISIIFVLSFIDF